MAKINLLPWRDEYRKEKQQEFITVLVGVGIIAALAAYLWINTINGQIADQQARNQLLEKEIALLDKKVAEIKELKERRRQLIERMKVIQGLQGERPVIVRYFDELVRSMPEGVYLTDLVREGGSIKMSGVTESNVRVSALMRNVDASEWFASPNLSSVKAAPELGEQASQFELTIVPSKPKDMIDEEDE
ncbi:MAG: type 4a pilus biogenesis protein PilN [Candidatus Pelagadaptatus aseana]|uniref:PilN domain-containing protein n=1 Tax=Candidatus Pelagadaptatus aseana TaxID=3120508 RepID=UPI0039B2ECB3